MKRIIILLGIVVISAFAGRILLQSFNEKSIKAPTSVKTDQERVRPSPTLAATKGVPQKVTIPAINVSAEVESVGMDDQGRMDVPKNDFNVAWYNLGFKPGEQGSAVIAGHFDARTGGPAIFYNLSKLGQGDTIKVEYENGNTFEFIVTKQEEYDFDKVPLEQIFNSTDKSRLNLITCDGVFDKSSSNYSKRLVVYAELKK